MNSRIWKWRDAIGDNESALVLYVFRYDNSLPLVDWAKQRAISPVDGTDWRTVAALLRKDAARECVREAVGQPRAAWGPEDKARVVAEDGHFIIYVGIPLPPYTYVEAEDAAHTLAAIWEYQEPK